MTIKDSKYVKINSVNPLYLMFSSINGYFEEIIGNKYLTPTNESKEKLKKPLRIKIRDLIGSVTKNLDDYVGKYMKIKLESVDKLPRNDVVENKTKYEIKR